MSDHVGDRLPAPVGLELGHRPRSGEAATAVILGTIDEDGSIRFAVLSTAEISPIDDKRLRIALAAESTTCSNLIARKAMSLWYVLDGAAYTIKGRMTKPPRAAHDGRSTFEVEIESVWRDFRPDAPMTCGPTYRAPQAD
ncbi:MAG TPA: hypothetical protein VFO25_09850 [Candidatus Eremiobacteraceae bacterium]|nr:hypothetical protein [Candidatus Eremiobacteraceae bacterium]